MAKYITLIFFLLYGTRVSSLMDVPPGVFGDGGSCTYSEILVAVQANGTVWFDRQIVRIDDLANMILQKEEGGRLDCILIFAEPPLEKSSKVIMEVEEALRSIEHEPYFAQDTVQ